MRHPVRLSSLAHYRHPFLLFDRTSKARQLRETLQQLHHRFGTLLYVDISFKAVGLREASVLAQSSPRLTSPLRFSVWANSGGKTQAKDPYENSSNG